MFRAHRAAQLRACGLLAGEREGRDGADAARARTGDELEIADTGTDVEASDLLAIAECHVPEIRRHPVGGGGEPVPGRRHILYERKATLALARLVAAGTDDA